MKRLGDEVPAERPVGYSASKIFAETDGTAVEEKDGAVGNDGNVGNDGAVEAEVVEEELVETNQVVEEEDADTVEYLISAFGKNYRLDFRRNSRLVPPGFRAVFRRYRIFFPVQLLLFWVLPYKQLYMFAIVIVAVAAVAIFVVAVVVATVVAAAVVVVAVVVAAAVVVVTAAADGIGLVLFASPAAAAAAAVAVVAAAVSFN